MLARFATCHRMGGDLSFKARQLLFPRLTNQHPLTRLPQAIKVRVFCEAHQVISIYWV